VPIEWMPEKKGEWAETTLKFQGENASADELRFVLPKGSTLFVDDVLLYEPK
jgi:hypothetical protein